MPISGTVLGALITAEMFGKGLAGQSTPALASAIGTGVATTVLSSAIYTGSSTGLGLGAGSSTGKLSGGITVSTIVANQILGFMAAFGLFGEKSKDLADAIGAGIAKHFATAIVTGASTVVGPGTGTGIITGVVGPALGAAIFAQMQLRGLTGQYTLQLANAIGNGVAISFTQTTVTTTTLGPAVGTVPPAFPPIPAGGTDTGKIV